MDCKCDVYFLLVLFVWDLITRKCDFSEIVETLIFVGSLVFGVFWVGFVGGWRCGWMPWFYAVLTIFGSILGFWGENGRKPWFYWVCGLLGEVGFLRWCVDEVAYGNFGKPIAVIGFWYP